MYQLYQLDALRTLSKIDKYTNVHLALGLVGELGEIKKTPNLDEFGDFLWYLALYLKLNNLTFERPLDVKISDYATQLDVLTDCVFALAELEKKITFYKSMKWVIQRDHLLSDIYLNYVALVYAYYIDKQLYLEYEYPEFEMFIYKVIGEKNINKLKNRYPDKFNTQDAENNR